MWDSWSHKSHRLFEESESQNLKVFWARTSDITCIFLFCPENINFGVVIAPVSPSKTHPLNLCMDQLRWLPWKLFQFKYVLQPSTVGRAGGMNCPTYFLSIMLLIKRYLINNNNKIKGYTYLGQGHVRKTNFKSNPINYYFTGAQTGTLQGYITINMMIQHSVITTHNILDSY